VHQVRKGLLGLTSRLGASRIRRLALPLSGIGLVALAIGVLVAAELPAASKGAAQPKASAGAATVQQRDLVATDTESGTLGYAGQQTVYNRVSGTITWLPAAGQVIHTGQTLYKVDNAPVVLFNGSTPAYRALSSGDADGPDIQELNQNLVNLGYDPSHQIAVDQTWQAATTAAVDRWQAALGETQIGIVALGQIVFLPGSQLIKSVQTVLGSTGGSSGSSASSGSLSATGASLISAAPAPQFVSLTTTTTTFSSTTSTTTTPAGTTGPSGTKPGSSTGKSGGSSSSAQLQALVALLKAEVAELKKSLTSTGSASRTGASTSGGASSKGSSGGGASSAPSGSSGTGAASASSGGATAQAIMQTTSTQEVVTVQLDATKQTEAVVGGAVTVQLPDGSTVNGKITQVSPVAQSSSSSSSASGAGAGAGSSSTPTATIPVTITLTGHTRVSGLDQAAVSVNFAQQRANNVLSVPVTALIAVQGGGYAVQTASAPHRLIPVTPGLFAAGYVQISGSGIYPGLQVTDSQG